MLIYKTIEKKDLRYALANKEFFLAFQPIINLKSDGFETFEAFIRWHHPTLGALPPTVFMNLVEKYDLHEELTRHVIDCAVTQIMNNYKSGYGETGVNINLTVQEFCNPDTIMYIAEAIKKLPSPEFLGLEISSKILMIYAEGNPQDTEYHPDCVPSEAEKVFLQELRTISDQYINIGVTLALDTTDYVIGSLIRAEILGFHALKISTKALQRAVLTNIKIIGEYVQASKDFGIPIIAVGIEEQSLFQTIYNNHIIYAQGSFFCPPLVLNDPKKFKTHLDAYFNIKSNLIQTQESHDALKELAFNLSEETHDKKSISEPEIAPLAPISDCDKTQQQQTQTYNPTVSLYDTADITYTDKNEHNSSQHIPHTEQSSEEKTQQPLFGSPLFKKNAGFGNNNSFGKKLSF
jgi:EAL domain-containing protein (putative c-di-GMP-specific phosphodiesterase class I)